MPICCVDGCILPHVAKGYCGRHYKRWKATGDVGPAGPLPKGGYRPGAGEKPGPLNHHWHGDAAGDAAKRARAQRAYPLATCEGPGCSQPATERHHVDGNPGNNVPENIRRLCRACHMRLDGRAAALAALGRARPKRPPKPCRVCGELAKPLRRGECRACSERRYARALVQRVGLPYRQAIAVEAAP